MKSNYDLDDYLSIHLSKRCNLKCPHCYQKTYDSEIIDIENIKKAVAIFNPTWLVLYGGEPMIEQEIIKTIFKEFPDKKFLMYTNGTIWNEEIFERLDKIVVTIESFFYDEAIKYRPLTKKQHAKSIELVRKYKSKTEILHNIYPTSHDKYFYRMAKLLDIPVQSYPIIRQTEKFKFDMSMLDAPFFFREMPPNTLPKMRLLENGILTRDMRGIHNICHVNDWKEELDKELPLSDKCKACKYLNFCPASSIFPHFVNDTLEKIEKPHFCKMTENVYEKSNFLRDN